MSRLDFTLEMRKKYPESCKMGIHRSMPDWVYFDNEKEVYIAKEVVFSEFGFGYEWDNEKYLRIPHVGKLYISNNVEIHPLTNIVRPTLESTVIGEGTKIDSLVHVAHNVNIGKHCLIVAGTIIGGSVKIGHGTFIGMGAIIKNKVQIGNNCVIGAGAVVIRDVPDNVTVAGVPAKIIKKNEQKD